MDISNNSKDNMLFDSALINSKGQIVIPAKFRRLFGMESGTTVMLVGNAEQDGFAVLSTDGFSKLQIYLNQMADAVQNRQNK
jgi:AbrB family looped-hinge helix DNA binding protein